MQDNRPRPCKDFIRLEEEVKLTVKDLHRGDVLMAQIKEKLNSIDNKVDQLDKKMDSQFEKVSVDIENLKSRPTKKWDGLSSTVIAVIVATIIGMMVTSFSGM